LKNCYSKARSLKGETVKENKEFEIGDVVKLKSNPAVPMTIEDIVKGKKPGDEKAVIKCVWFAGALLQRDTFSAELLKRF
jgi:uncharacterized protein YodC (DUF2158 family)